VTAAGRSARAEYERRRRLDREQRRAELRHTVPAVAIAAVVTAVVRLGLTVLGTWPEPHHGLSTSGLLPPSPPWRLQR
jgi:hypothetical protein